MSSEIRLISQDSFGLDNLLCIKNASFIYRVLCSRHIHNHFVRGTSQPLGMKQVRRCSLVLQMRKQMRTSDFPKVTQLEAMESELELLGS